MKKPTITKFCNLNSESYARPTEFEKRFESYIESKVSDIMKYPSKYPNIKIFKSENK